MQIAPTIAAAADLTLGQATFYGVVATIIPVLGLAILFQAGTLEELGGPPRRVFIGLAYAAIAIAEEGRALWPLLNGHATTTGYARHSMGGMMVLLGLVLFGPFWREVKRIDVARAMENKSDIRAASYFAYFTVFTLATAQVSGQL